LFPSVLIAEIDRVLKKVDEGAEFFDEIWLKGKELSDHMAKFGKIDCMNFPKG
jgi:hypothetical protein